MNILKSVTFTCVLLFLTSTSFAIDSSSGTGTVAETMDSGGYTYIRLEENDQWVACQPVTVSIGDSVEYADAIEMGEFHSRTLDRTFERILFTQKLEIFKPVEADAHANSAEVATLSDQLGITKSTASAAPETG